VIPLLVGTDDLLLSTRTAIFVTVLHHYYISYSNPFVAHINVSSAHIYSFLLNHVSHLTLLIFSGWVFLALISNFMLVVEEDSSYTRIEFIYILSALVRARAGSMESLKQFKPNNCTHACPLEASS